MQHIFRICTYIWKLQKKKKSYKTTTGLFVKEAIHKEIHNVDDVLLFNLAGRYVTIGFIPGNWNFKFHTSYPNMSFVVRYILNADISNLKNMHILL